MKTKVVLEWRQTEFMQEVAEKAAQGMEAACEFAAETMRKNAPARTGQLKESIGYEVQVDGLSVRGLVGVRRGFKRSHVARFLEFGTSKMVAQPFMRRTIRENAKKIRRLIASGGRR